MKSIIQKISIGLTSLTCIVIQMIPWIAPAKLPDLIRKTHDLSSQQNNTIEHSKECSSLINLERKSVLSEPEFKQGILLHSLIQQISSNPLEYCNDILLAESFDEIETEDVPH